MELTSACLSLASILDFCKLSHSCIFTSFLWYLRASMHHAHDKELEVTQFMVSTADKLAKVDLL